MSSSRQELKTLLAQGKLETALETLVHVTAHGHDAELRQRVLNLSGQFAQLKNQHLTGLLDDKDYRLQWNRIAAAVADIAAIDNGAVTARHRRTSGSDFWKKLGYVGLIVGILAGVVKIVEYLQKQEPAPTVQPAAEPPQKDTLVVATPPTSKPAEKPASGKNNVKIEVKDKAKVGNIITGDSNKIDIKQDFGQ